MKTVKNIATFLVFCFAAFGVYTILKQPAQLHVTQDEQDRLEQELGISLVSGDKMKGGQSALFNTVVLPEESDDSLSSSSKAPPGLFGAPKDTAPPFSATSAPPKSDTMEDAPVFVASRSTEAPPFAPTIETNSVPKAFLETPGAPYGNLAVKPEKSEKPSSPGSTENEKKTSKTNSDPAPAKTETPISPIAGEPKEKQTDKPTEKPAAKPEFPVVKIEPESVKQPAAPKVEQKPLTDPFAVSCEPVLPSPAVPEIPVVVAPAAVAPAAPKVDPPKTAALIPTDPFSAPPTAPSSKPISPVVAQSTKPEPKPEPKPTAPKPTVSTVVSPTVTPAPAIPKEVAAQTVVLPDEAKPAITNLPTPQAVAETPNFDSETVSVPSIDPANFNSSSVGPTFVPPQVKQLPTVREPVPVPLQLAQNQLRNTDPKTMVSPVVPQKPEPIPGQTRLQDQAQIEPENPTVPTDYQNTSIRSAMVLTPVVPSKPGPNPVVSFSPPNMPSKGENGQSASSAVATPPDTTPLVAVPAEAMTPVPSTPPASTQPASTLASAPLVASVPKPAIPKEVPTVPFTEPPKKDPLIANPIAGAVANTTLPKEKPVKSPGPLVTSVRPMEPTPEIRDTVVRFVKAQCALIDTGELNNIRSAYIQLSRLHDHPELNDAERVFVTPILDQLSLDIVYARRNHILEPAYVVKPGETVDSIAAAFNLSPNLLRKINGLSESNQLPPGTELKIVLGHFDAKVSTSRREITLILGGLFAGRFPISLGENILDTRGDFVVTSRDETERGVVLTLSNGIRIQGIDRPQPGDSLATTIRCSERDAAELFDILGERSVIVLGD